MIEQELFDVAIIGTGAGGGTLGYELARRNKRVLFIERGKRLDTDPSVVRGAMPPSLHDETTALRYGWWPHRSKDQLYLGCGTGGSTSLFAMLMERFRPEDFTPRQFFPEAKESTIPEAWPLTYSELEPYYDRAEALYRVRGTVDPLHPKPGGLSAPQEMTDKERAIHAALSGAGLHPYRMHAACERVQDCATCVTVLCPNNCRNDAGKICVRPAIEEHRASILAETKALALETSGRTITGVRVQRGDREVVLRAKIFVLSAGALHTPALLHDSKLGNALVGCNLMLHQSDFLLLRLKKHDPELPPLMNHGVMFMDHYFHRGMKLGNVHAHPLPFTEAGMRELLERRAPQLAKLPKWISAGIARWAARKNRAAAAFATVLEDLPYAHNRVTAPPSYEYRYPAELRARSEAFFAALKSALGATFDIEPLNKRGSLNFGHFAGTCRFGTDPKTSVLDRDCRLHDADNLYVVDGSFLPSSAGMNPSLTIAANALRVGERIAERV